MTSVVADRVGDQIAEDMRNLPQELRKALRPRLRAAGQAVANDAKARASYSSRIPQTVRVETSFRFDREGVFIKAGGKNAPHARLLESVGGHSHFRHPVYGNRNKWVSQRTRPFLFPAARAHENQTTDAITAALDDAARGIGFGG